MIQRVLGEDRWASAMGAEDLRALNPLLYSHVNPYAVFNLDLSTRLPVDESALGGGRPGQATATLDFVSRT